jgi:flagellar M-ring protein FliF
VLDLVRTLALPAALSLVALLVFFGLVRPGMKAMLAARPRLQPGANLDTVENEQTALPALPAPASQAHLEGAKTMARQNPAAVAGILRGWVDGQPITTR